MKPIVTWVLVANTRNVSVYENRGPGKGLVELSDMKFRPVKADLPRDKAGVGHSIAGHGLSAVEQSDPQEKLDARFARDVAAEISLALGNHKFNRLIVAAGPHMLGLLRGALDEPVKAALIGEIDKDLSNQTAEAVARHIEQFIVP
ncbi:MAG: host attachment protein [Silicimonas sp.]|nr:host attachment protein [Silicimonas sp.]